MKVGLCGAVTRVAGFLGYPLTPEELQKVARKSSFEYMKKHEVHFEMYAPNVFSVSAGEGRFMKAGTIDRYKDIGENEGETIMAFCRDRLEGSDYPLDNYYHGATAVKMQPTPTC